VCNIPDMNREKTVELSIITVVLNDYAGLSKTIASVTGQKFLELEHIVVDGGSTDGSAELARKFSSIPIPSKPDGGIYPAMQRGASCASGEFLIFCNAGDVIFGDNFLAEALAQLQKEKSLWGFGPIIEHTERNTFAWVSTPTKANSEMIISRKIFVPFPSFIINRNLYLGLGGLTDSYKIAGDFELICKAANFSPPSIFRDPIALFAAGGVSYLSADKAWKEEIAIRVNLLGLDFSARCGQWIKFFIRFAKWKTGKFLDLVQSLFPIKGLSWREFRAKEVPSAYRKFLTN
jgi:glycosyltransferase involved in cell wall biosynthesis